MIKKIFLPTCLIISSLAPLSVYSLTLADYLTWAKECHTISQKLAKLSMIQRDGVCISTLNEAETDTELAANYLENEEYHAAKNYLNYTNNGLKYAVMMSCENSLEIDVAKNELMEINGHIADIFSKKHCPIKNTHQGAILRASTKDSHQSVA